MKTRRQLLLKFLGLCALSLVGVMVALVIGYRGTADGPPPLLHQTGAGYYTEVALLDPASGIIINLTRHPARDTTPAWLPDGTALSFASNRGDGDMDLYRLDLHTREVALIADTAQQGAFLVHSPDGTQAAYLEGSGTYTDVILLQADGTRRPITHNGVVASSPVWSPDGKQVAYVNALQNVPDVFVADAAGGRPQRVTQNAMASSPVWMPDGTQIAYSTRSERNWRLVFVVDLATGESRKIFEGADTWLLAWSPDMDHIAYIAGEGEARDLHIAQFDPDPARERDLDAQRITDGLVLNTLSWSGDGQWLAFTARPVADAWENGAATLHSGPLSGVRFTLNRWLQDDPPSDVALEELYIYRRGWDAPRRVTTTPGQEAYPSWRPVALTSDAEGLE